MDRDALAEFLRLRREAIKPADVGLPPGVRRRTAGLRREEVAQLTGMSVDYYGRLEQARSTQPSPQMLRALARTLRLTDDEADHLYRLAGHAVPDFTDPRARDAAPEAERDEHSRTIVADLRAAWARRRNDADMRELVEGLLERSREFAELWARHEVAVRRMQRKTFLTRVGAITLDCEVLATTDGQHLVVLAPPPGSSALENLRLLAVLGDQAVGYA
jgi:transcriptional regulator with XRE-family HTH domain